MATLASGFWRLGCQRQLARPPRCTPTSAQLTQALPAAGRRFQSTDELQQKLSKSTAELVESTVIPFRGLTHARPVPRTPSYFSRDPHFNDLYVRATNLLVRYKHLPTLQASQAPHVFWLKLDDLRGILGENIKAAHYAKVMRVVKRLHLIEPSMKPAEVDLVLSEFKRAIDPRSNQPKPITIDRYGRALGVGRRKAATARAFVVEGTGDIQVNGKSLSEMFGRVHDRESAVWALTASQRLDKYNVWAMVEGGGTTGQAEALTLAVAKALVAHEPDLKTSLRKGAFPHQCHYRACPRSRA